MNSVQIESDPASAARRWRGARNAESLSKTHIYAKRYFRYYLIRYINTYTLSLTVVEMYA